MGFILGIQLYHWYCSYPFPEEQTTTKSPSVLLLHSVEPSPVESNFFVVEEGRKIEGAFVHKLRSVLFPAHCSWCSFSGICIRGTLLVGSIDSAADNRLIHAFKLVPGRSFTSSDVNQQSHFTHFTYYIVCTLEHPIPEDLQGILKLKDRFEVPVVPWKSNLQPKNYICNSRAHLDTSADKLRYFVEFYTTKQRGFDSVIIYDYGFDYAKTTSDLIRNDERLSNFVKSGKLIVVNLEQAMQRLYGPLYAEAVYFSFAFGQLITTYDCLSRTKNLNAKWALFIDRDEFLTFGRNRMKHFPPPVPKETNYIEFRYKWLVDEKADKSYCRICDLGYWDEEAAFQFHQEQELTSNKYGRWDAPAQLGKYAIKVQEFAPRDLNIHVVNSGAKAPVVVHYNDMYLRHYRECAQVDAYCEGENKAFSRDWWLTT